MAPLKWNCVAFTAALAISITLCAANRVGISTMPSPKVKNVDESELRILGEMTDQGQSQEAGGGIVTDGGGGFSHAYRFGHGRGGGGGGGGWHGGYGSDGWPGYGGGGGGGGYRYDFGYDGDFPPGFIPQIGGPFHCQPLNCGYPGGCPGFVFHLTSKSTNQARDKVNNAQEVQSKKNSNSESSGSG